MKMTMISDVIERCASNRHEQLIILMLEATSSLLLGHLLPIVSYLDYYSYYSTRTD